MYVLSTQFISLFICLLSYLYLLFKYLFCSIWLCLNYLATLHHKESKVQKSTDEEPNKKMWFNLSFKFFVFLTHE